MSPASKRALLSIIFGGHINEYDYHKTGFFYELLERILTQHQFCSIRRVDAFGIFDDASGMVLGLDNQVFKYTYIIFSAYVYIPN